jgi:hypothetical protein
MKAVLVLLKVESLEAQKQCGLWCDVHAKFHQNTSVEGEKTHGHDVNMYFLFKIRKVCS